MKTAFAFIESIEEQKIQDKCTDSNLERIEAALIQRATGFTHTEVKTEIVGGKEKRVETEKYQPPDMAAIKFWLMNRAPARWKNDGGHDDVPIELVVERRDDEA